MKRSSEEHLNRPYNSLNRNCCCLNFFLFEEKYKKTKKILSVTIPSYKKHSYLLLGKFLEIHFFYFYEKITIFPKCMQFEAKIFLYIFVHIAQKMLIGIDFHLKK